jgi:hypothetical protein
VTDYPDPYANDDLLAGLRNGAWLDQQDFPPLKYAVPGLIPEGTTLLVGPPKIGKSWFVLACALATASGGVVLDKITVTARPTLYLALEDGDRRMQARCRMLLGDDPIPGAFEYLTTIAPGRIVETIAAWLRRHPGADPLVILDTLGKVMPQAMPGESPYQRDYRIGSALKQVTDEDSGRSLVVNHHDRKAAADDFVDSVSGTHGLAGAADTTVVLVRGRNEREGLLKVTGRDVAEGQYAVTFIDNCSWRLDGSTLAEAAKAGAARRASSGLGDRSTDIIELMGSRPDESVTPKEVAEKLAIDEKIASNYLNRLATKGRIDKLGRGRYVLPYPPGESGGSGESE